MISLAWMLTFTLTAQPIGLSTTVVVVVGAPGTSEYERQFSQWAERWREAARAGDAEFIGIGLDTAREVSDRERFRAVLETQQRHPQGELWLVLIGHGTFDGRAAKFNLRGSDISAADLDGWLQGLKRPVAVINCSSASGPFLRSLSSEGRVVVTAARSGYEHNFSRFGDYLSRSIAESSADLDRDGQTSLLEAFVTASRQTQEFYRAEGRLATEHALLDDNGDGLGVQADRFRGLSPVGTAVAGSQPDGYRAHQFHLLRSRREQRMSPKTRRQRDELELAVIRLRERKSELAEDEYYEQLETLLLRLARLYERQPEVEE